MHLPFPFFNYSPYTRTFLGFSIYTDNEKSTSEIKLPATDGDETNLSDYKSLEANLSRQEDEFLLFTNIDLYRQPVLPPILSLIVIPIIQIIFVASAIFIQYRTWQMLKRETSVNNLMMVTQAKIHIIFWPNWALAVTFTESFYPLDNLITPYACHMLKFYIYFCLFSFILYSFYASLSRYLFCIHTTRVTKFGREKLIKILYWIFYIHTFVWTVYTHATSFNMDHLPIINSCFGVQHNIFLMESSTLNMLKRHFCVLRTGNMNNQLQ